MTSIPQETRTRAPWHLWVVGILSLLWNTMGAIDYLMTETKNPAYMGKFTPEQLEYFYGYPAWVVSAWAIAVWGAVLGSVLLLLRRKAAYWVFLVSFLGLVGNLFYSFVLTDGMRIMGGPGPFVFTMAIVVVAILLIFYSRAQKRSGTLL